MIARILLVSIVAAGLSSCVLPPIAPDKHLMMYIIPLFVNVNLFRLTGMKITGRISKTSVFVNKYVIQDSEIMMILTWFGALPVITAGDGTHGTIHTNTWGWNSWNNSNSYWYNTNYYTHGYNWEIPLICIPGSHNVSLLEAVPAQQYR